jgi:hypothetical protein
VCVCEYLVPNSNSACGRSSASVLQRRSRSSQLSVTGLKYFYGTAAPPKPARTPIGRGASLIRLPSCSRIPSRNPPGHGRLDETCDRHGSKRVLGSRQFPRKNDSVIARTIPCAAHPQPRPSPPRSTHRPPSPPPIPIRPPRTINDGPHHIPSYSSVCHCRQSGSLIATLDRRSVCDLKIALSACQPTLRASVRHPVGGDATPTR